MSAQCLVRFRCLLCHAYDVKVGGHPLPVHNGSTRLRLRLPFPVSADKVFPMTVEYRIRMSCATVGRPPRIVACLLPRLVSLIGHLALLSNTVSLSFRAYAAVVT